MTSELLVVLASFIACSVEMVEAWTIVFAAGRTRGWRSAIEGSIAAFLVLVLIVGIVGTSLIHLIPIDALRITVGALLMILGLSWLRKAILRSSGHKAMHDEDLIYEKKVKELSGIAKARTSAMDGDKISVVGKVKRIYSTDRDSLGFVVAFKGVFLEGLEVAMIVITLGSSSHHFILAATGALFAAVAVTCAATLLARQLSEVPENKMKMVVGILLTSFGIFWVGEGAKIGWPGSDLSILWLIALFSAVSFIYTAILKNMLV